nr:photosystem I P700 chlorophyll a apoprotein A1-like [Aegilops tauschii subsp. strangulata]
MIFRSPEPEVKIVVDRDPVKTSLEEWARPRHFSRTLAKGPDTTTWIWKLHADAHDFDSHTGDLEEISRKVFSAHFRELSIIFLWLSGMYFHGARFSNYEACLSDPTHIGPSAQVVWHIVGQEILNGDVGGGFRGIQITSGFCQLWRASGITSELQLYCTAIGALIFAALMLFAGWFHYHKAAPKLAWFQDVESMLNHHLAGLLGLGIKKSVDEGLEAVPLCVSNLELHQLVFFDVFEVHSDQGQCDISATSLDLPIGVRDNSLQFGVLLF